MRYGFKSQAERISAAARGSLGLSTIDRLEPTEYAKRVGVHLLNIEELQISDLARHQLLVVDTSSWSGMAIQESGLTGILVNPTHSLERQASTLMHELAHIVLKHVPVRVDVSATGILLVSEYSEDDEQEANWLAGALLLPRDALVHYRGKNWSKASIMAHFGVSQEMYNWRIRMTGVELQIRRAGVSA